ncbi:hypothetical protein SAZ11_08100 [Streptomyces sp. FXJ1.4098]|nr:hypothetical protein [Streptomyces sp. FXJ1.4098]
MTEYPEIAAHVARDVKDGKLVELREDGLYRHVEFKALQGWSRIILVTWPYNLLVAGSHGSYHFERFGKDTEDMFDWLRGLRVDPDSWASKLVNGRDSVSEYDRSLTVAAINERVADAVENDWAPEGLQDAVREDILGSHLLDTKDTAFQLVSEFEHGKAYRPECSCGISGEEGSYSSATLWKVIDHKEDGEGTRSGFGRRLGSTSTTSPSGTSTSSVTTSSTSATPLCGASPSTTPPVRRWPRECRAVQRPLPGRRPSHRLPRRPPEDHRDATRLVTRTRSRATLLGGHKINSRAAQ